MTKVIQRKPRMTLALDFDGTICKFQSFGPLTNPPNEGAQEAITKLKDAGWKIIVHTCRARPDWPDVKATLAEIERWMKKWKIPYDEITAIKPLATAYIDDRGIRFTNWKDMQNYFI